MSLGHFLRNAAHTAARSRSGSWVIRLVCDRFPVLLPVRWITRRPDLLAFHHPLPGYSIHIVLIPRPVRSGLSELGAHDGLLLVAVFQLFAVFAEQFQPHLAGLRLVVNGGEYQDVSVLHFHVISQK